MKTWTKQDLLQKTWIKLLRYIIFQYYIDTITSKFCAPVILEYLLCLPFGAKIDCTKTWTKHGNNLDFFFRKNWEPYNMSKWFTLWQWDASISLVFVKSNLTIYMNDVHQALLEFSHIVK